MRADLINPFLKAACDVIKSVAGAEAKKGELSLNSPPVKGDEVNTTIGVTGDLLGQIIICMSQSTAAVLASHMLLGIPVTSFDELAKSAISEFGNMVTGNAITELGEKGLICHITPPALFMGKDVILSAKNLSFLIIPLLTDLGDIKINIALREVDNGG